MFLATFIIKIPVFQGYIHLGDAFTLLSGIILGPLYGALPAGYFAFEYFVLKVGKAVILGVPFNAFQAGVGIVIAEFVVRHAGNKLINKTYNK